MPAVIIEIKEYSNECGSWIRPVFTCTDCKTFDEGSIDPYRIMMPPGGWRIYRDGSVRCRYCAKRKEEAERNDRQ